MYGSGGLFIGKEISEVEMVYLSFLKKIFGVKQQATSVTIYGDTGRYPLFLKQQILALKYWIRLISLPKSCYSREVHFLVKPEALAHCSKSKLVVLFWFSAASWLKK